VVVDPDDSDLSDRIDLIAEQVITQMISRRDRHDRSAVLFERGGAL
jgi:hypothetical protein